MAEAGGSADAAQAEYWNSQAARGWADQHQRMDRVLVPLLEALMTAAAPQPGERVLDIGCGSVQQYWNWWRASDPPAMRPASTSPRRRSRKRSGGSPPPASARPTSLSRRHQHPRLSGGEL